MPISNEERLLRLIMLKHLSNTGNQYLTHESFLLRVLQHIAEIGNVSWSALMDTVKQGTCKLDQGIHDQILDIWETSRRRQATLDEQNCVERILARDYVRPADLIKWAIILGKQAPSPAVWKLFAVDGFQGSDLKSYINHFKLNDVGAKHVEAVRSLYDKGVENPEKMREIIDNVFNGENSHENEYENFYIDIVGLENIPELRELKRSKQADEEDKASSSGEPPLKKKRRKPPAESKKDNTD